MIEAQKPAIDTGWDWFAGDNEELYRIGPLSTRDEAIAEAIKSNIGDVIYVVEARQDPIDLSSHIDVDMMVEELHESLSSNYGGDDGESPADDAWNDEQHTDLEASIVAAVAAWQERHGIVVIPRRFSASRNAERIVGATPATANDEEPNEDEIVTAALAEVAAGEPVE